MAATHPSSTEAKLESQRLSALQIRVILICTLAQIFDGFDIYSISMAVPALAGAWHLPGASFANTFVMSGVGTLTGALTFSPVGDRLGRKPVLVASLVLLAVFSFACVFATTIPELVAFRFFTGLGIGALMPATVALSSDYAPERLRAPVVMLVFTGSPLGSFVGGQVVAQLLPLYGWRMVFVIGGLLPLLLLPVALPWLPESPRILLKRGRMTPATLRLFKRLDIDPAGTGHVVDVALGNPVAGLFRDRLAPVTVLVWILYFSNLLSIYMIGYWLPTVLSLSGMSPANAVSAASLMNGGPLVSVFAMVPLAQRFGPPVVLAAMLSAGILAIGAVGLGNLSGGSLLAVIFVMGCCTTGSMTGINGMTAALYPARVRTAGMGWALGIGRLGAIGGPWLGGFLLVNGWPPLRIFLCACVTAAVATGCVAMLGLLAHQRRSAHGPGHVAVTATSLR